MAKLQTLAGSELLYNDLRGRKIEKPSSATSGNIVIFDNNRNVVDSGQTLEWTTLMDTTLTEAASVINVYPTLGSEEAVDSKYSEIWAYWYIPVNSEATAGLKMQVSFATSSGAAGLDLLSVQSDNWGLIDKNYDTQVSFAFNFYNEDIADATLRKNAYGASAYPQNAIGTTRRYTGATTVEKKGLQFKPYNASTYPNFPVGTKILILAR